MKAIRFMEPEVIEYSAVATPEPKDNEVLAQIAYAGFCATDIELLTGDMIHIKNGFTKYPIIPGHEWSGTIVAVGRDVRDLKVGDRITSDVSLGCGECDECRKGHYNLCPNREVVGSYRNLRASLPSMWRCPSGMCTRSLRTCPWRRRPWQSRRPPPCTR